MVTALRQLYIADLHLSEQCPRLTRGFLGLLLHYQQQPTALYILGDWFNVWLSDYDASHWLLPIVAALREFTARGNQVYVMIGNRDFIMGERFVSRFGGQLIQEPYYYQFGQLRIRLEHGDALCTDDVSYQTFKRRIRHPISLMVLKGLPLYVKRRIAQYARQKSQSMQTARPLVDVNADAVVNAMQGVDVLIHGHTHRPNSHHMNSEQQRIVLGDWHVVNDIGHAQIVLIDEQQHIHRIDWQF